MRGRKRVARPLKFSDRKVRVNSWKPAERDGTSGQRVVVTQEAESRRKAQEVDCEVSPKVGQQSTNRLQEEC